MLSAGFDFNVGRVGVNIQDSGKENDVTFREGYLDMGDAVSFNVDGRTYTIDSLDFIYMLAIKNGESIVSRGDRGFSFSEVGKLLQAVPESDLIAMAEGRYEILMDAAHQDQFVILDEPLYAPDSARTAGSKQPRQDHVRMIWHTDPPDWTKK